MPATALIEQPDFPTMRTVYASERTACYGERFTASREGKTGTGFNQTEALMDLELQLASRD